MQMDEKQLAVTLPHSLEILQNADSSPAAAGSG
jgi:hypothetical protein